MASVSRVRVLEPVKTRRVEEPLHVKSAGAQSPPEGEGCVSPVIKVWDHGRHVMSSSPVPLKTRREGTRCTLNLPRAETSSRWCGVVRKKIEKSYQRLYLGYPKSFKDWKMLIYVVKSSSQSFCRAWDRVIIGRDDSDRLVRNLRIWSENPSLIILDIKPSCQILSKALAMSTNSIPVD
ncbi:hypothetical protein TNCV_1354191 [Trichonephila clavipes]|nr:hypothetical protein TNCV_1354191 [Trichonephila clavipes]